MGTNLDFWNLGHPHATDNPRLPGLSEGTW
jgi:hypothetical protein